MHTMPVRWLLPPLLNMRAEEGEWSATGVGVSGEEGGRSSGSCCVATACR